MLYCYTTTNQTVASGGNIVFNENGVARNKTSSHTVGSDTIKLNANGYYKISFNASAVESGIVGNVIAQMYKNGSVLNGATSVAYSSAESDIVNVNFNAIVKVYNCCCNSDPVTITIVNNGVSAIYNNASIVVERIA